MIFPFSPINPVLLGSDFKRFSEPFSKVVLQYLPGDTVNFYPLQPDLRFDFDSGEGKKKLPYGAEMVEQKKKPVFLAQPPAGIKGPAVYLPVFNDHDLLAVAEVYGKNINLEDQVTQNWLNEYCRIISRELQLLKMAIVDPESGLLNSQLFYESISGFFDSGDNLPLGMVLIEVLSNRWKPEKAIYDLKQAAQILSLSLSGLVSVYHLGYGIFAIIMVDSTEEETDMMAKSLLEELRIKNFFQIHIGINWQSWQAPPRKSTQEQDNFLNQTWEALNAARKRGAYGICSYAAVGLPEHPLKASKKVITCFKRHWRTSKKFSLVLMRSNSSQTNSFSKKIISLIGQLPVIQTTPDELFIFIDQADSDKANLFVENLKSKLAVTISSSFSFGIGNYPFNSYSKAETVVNTRKAILHGDRALECGEIKNPDFVITCNQVSLTVAGDLYFNDGNYLKAEKEYKNGLMIEPESIILLNSSGVNYARMNQYEKALPFFTKVLKIDKSDIMALYNLAYAFSSLGQFKRAESYFLKVHKIEPDLVEIQVQLGRLFCKNGKYQKAIMILAKIEKENKFPPSAINRWLGEAYFKVGKEKKSKTYFHRALRYNPNDASSLTLLARIYVHEDHNHEIALIYCRQAIELDPLNSQHWYSLALTEFTIGSWSKAMETLETSLSLAKNNLDSICLTGRILQHKGEHKKAYAMYKKALKINPECQDALNRIRMIQ
jgi:tetratricopeptide (TPR) repeat protein